MLKFIIIQLILVSFIRCNCLLNLRTNISEDVPVLIQNNEFVLPSYYGFINIKENTSVTLLCTGYLNSVVTGIQCSEFFDPFSCYNANKALDIFCQRRKFYISGIEIRDFLNVACVRTNIADVFNTEKPCANGLGKIIWIGYIVRAKFIKLYEVCYDKDLSRTLYTKHELLGQSIGTVQTPESYCTQYKSNSYAYDISIDAVYSKENQQIQLANVFNVPNYNNFQMNYTTRLIKSRLVPRQDFIFVAWQESTAFLINTMPQWKTISKSRWEDIEVKVRLFATRTIENLMIHTGTHGVMSVKGNDNEERELYLSLGTKLPVPEYFWKIVQHENRGILFIILNDPFSNDYTDFCESICREYCWYFANYAIPEITPMWCCNVTEEILTELNLPNLNITEVLSSDECWDKK